MSEVAHRSVMLDEVMAALRPAPGMLIVDATFGAGGYSSALLDAGARVVAFDRDPAVLAHAAPLAASGRFRLVEDRFSAMAARLDAPIDAAAFDLGVSSMQIDEPERGFSFQHDGPLDMRMGRTGANAADLVNGADQAELARIFFVYGEEKSSRRIAQALVRRRATQPFTRTLDLAYAVERALGGRKGAKVHPATRVFQALRIAVNAELTELEAGLEAAEQLLRDGGRLAVVSFHSLEDRIVKAFLTERAGRAPGGSRHRPPTEEPRKPSFRLLFNGAAAPSAAEIAANPRARSAKLRAAERTAAPAWRATA
ncbi:MAG TPA: 16S rRNA (cytosine(1402)-N(4))-methyltransferase RsmH [Caulobacteraceae bacterium]|jgi:16S rRNA (cytosine1402-N4)-methyltransferase|nr:16S rRNA (cytosine(1402)-N(4))-methyltransferase RsmH [Caulobacteraceae bacterium]